MVVRRKSPKKPAASPKRKPAAKKPASPKRKPVAKKPKASPKRKRAASPKRKSPVMRGGSSSVNPTFKKLYKMLKNVPLIKIPVIPQFEQPGQKGQKGQKGQVVQKVQSGGYKKGYKLKTQENGTRKFVLAGYAYEKDLNKGVPVPSQIVYELEDPEEFGRFDNIKPQEAAKKMYSRLCKNLRKDYGPSANVCVNMLLQVQEQCCDNVTTNNKPRDYYYYIKNTPRQKVITKKDGKSMTVYNDAKAIPIFAVRNRRNEIVRMQTVNEAVAVAEKKRNTSLAVYAKRRSSGKKLLKNARA